MHTKDADEIANSVNLDQTAPLKEQSGLGLHCLLRNICPNTENLYGIIFRYTRSMRIWLKLL